jgi:hypothetical protein
MPDALSVERELNALLAELKKAVGAGAPAPDYAPNVAARAKAVHERIVKACSGGFQVDAHGGRIHRIQVVGGLKPGHTRFKYMRFARAFAEEEEDCELVDVVTFKVRSRA